MHVAIISKALFFFTFFTLLIFIVIHVHVHNRIFLWKYGHCQLCSMVICQNAMLEIFPCLSCVDRKKLKNDRIAYSDASVLVIKSRKSKGYAIADTDCT